MLYVVPTPIGNLEDMTYRAVRLLKEVDLVACEDTRTSGVLLNHYGIATPRISYHEHNEKRRAPELVQRMQGGDRVALISDAGTPGVSDPGFYLVRECLRNDIQVEVLPGATAMIPALVASGLPCDRFVYEGFFPQKRGRAKRLEALVEEGRTIVLYEAPHRLVKTLGKLAESLGADRPAAVARELTKKFEEVRRGTLQELMEHYGASTKVRGECVIVIAGRP